ncbi:alpha/beta hydrolase [Saccharibacillus endophyticus]|uniref:Alpha/beta hydrolase n=1 Tax=Saccharibacillus endophyticus TaxID=2060666 RepID=A0ABQ1ZVD9_9BACL|nr:alpha/beta hydrolase [Saccharibacillus endophyticus]
MLVELNEEIKANRFEIPIAAPEGLRLKGTFYPSKKSAPAKGTIVYFHGGGLIFGHRDDLPSVYVSMLTEHGYGLLTLDYPLAPETPLPAIMEAISRSIAWFTDQGFRTLGLENADHYLMGRSAGGYLALHYAVHASAAVKPLGVIAFYGYHTLSEASFHVPSRHFLAFPPVSDSTMQSLIAQQPIASSPSEQRYLLYLAARQRGNWITLLFGDTPPDRNFDLTKEQLATLPSTFLAAADQDPDVPVRQSKMLHKWIPDSELHLVQSTHHDFDRTQTEEWGLDVYSKLIKWLDRD